MIKLADIRNTAIVTPPPANRYRMRGHARRYPENTCTCLYELTRCNYCIRDRREISSNRHDTLLTTRQQNDWWLRRIGRDPTTGALGNVSHQKRTGRATKRSFRVCRCGDWTKPVAGRAPEVYMCLSCEGVIHVGPMAAGGGLPAGVGVNAVTRATDGNFQLRRP